MSGIYGMVRYDGAPVTAETLGPMAAAMAFWGPDGHGQWCGDCAGLGHLMLHVTPESLHERLPASIRVAPHLVITANARIDNRDELFDALGVPAAGRARTPDSSLILLAYERWEAECVKRLLGDFAFAIWDGRERRLFCARDPFGCMPFVYHYDGKRLIFASDIKGVLARMESPRLNEAMIAAYLHMMTYHAEKRLTFFEEIVKLPPAHTLTLAAGGLELSRYWSPENAAEVRLATDADYAEQMRILFQESVECRLRSAFPVGSHLSGGLDSSSISVAATRALRARGETLEVFSWSPPPEPGSACEPDSEHLRIEAVCRAERLSCHYLPTTVQGYFELFQRNFTVEPCEMMAREGSVQVSAARRGLRVMLSGWGGDEAVSNRASSGPGEFLARGQWHDLGRVLRFRMDDGDGAPDALKALRRVRRLGGVLRDVAIPQLPNFLFSLVSNNVWLEHENDCALSSFSRLHKQSVAALRGPAFRPQPGIRSTICHLLEYGHLSKRIEHWATSGAGHLVYRYPFLDRRLLEFTLGVPPDQLCRFGPRLPMFRRSVSGLLSVSGDWDRRKAESTALRALRKVWFGAHEDWARQLLAEQTSSQTRFVSPQAMWKAVQAHRGAPRMAALSGVREAFGCHALVNLTL